MKGIIIQILIKVGSDMLIRLLKAAADELEKRKDNNFSQAGEIKNLLSGVEVDGKQ